MERRGGGASVTRTVLIHSIVEGQYLKGWLRLQNVHARQIPLHGAFFHMDPYLLVTPLYSLSKREI